MHVGYSIYFSGSFGIKGYASLRKPCFWPGYSCAMVVRNYKGEKIK